MLRPPPTVQYCTSVAQMENSRVISYYSGRFNGAERRSRITRRELLAVVKALKHFKTLLLGVPVTVRTDHACLQNLFKSKSLIAQFERHLDFVSQFDLKIEYSPGKTQCISDFLSRLEVGDEHEPRCCEANGVIGCRSRRPKAQFQRGAGSSRAIQARATRHGGMSNFLDRHGKLVEAVRDVVT
jgi:hypothetical protein